MSLDRYYLCMVLRNVFSFILSSNLCKIIFKGKSVISDIDVVRYKYIGDV